VIVDEFGREGTKNSEGSFIVHDFGSKYTFLVPTLRVGMLSSTLCVEFDWTQSVRKCVTTQSVVTRRGVCILISETLN